MLRFYLNIQLRILYIPRDRPSSPATRLWRDGRLLFIEIVYFTDEICPEMRKRNAFRVILTKSSSKTHLPHTPYKTLRLTRLSKETTVPRTLSIVPHNLAQALPPNARVMTAFPLHKNNGKGLLE